MEVGRSRHEGTARSALKESAESTYLPAAFSRMPYRVCSDGTEVPLHELKRFVVDAHSLAAMLGSHEDVFEPQAALAEKLWKNNANPTGWLSSRPERASAPGRDPNSASFRVAFVADTRCVKCVLGEAADQVQQRADVVDGRGPDRKHGLEA